MPRSTIIKYAALIITLIAADQISKWFVVERFFKDGGMGLIDWFTNFSQPRLDFMRTEITSYFNMVMVWNEGVSFGLFSNAHDAMPIVLSLFAIILSGVFAVWLTRSVRLTTSLPICFIIAGAISNVCDRVRFGAVIDFLDFHWVGQHWPAFNMADSLIVIGVGLLALDTLFLEPKQTS